MTCPLKASCFGQEQENGVPNGQGGHEGMQE